MATRVPITVYEGSPATIRLTITPDVVTTDLDDVTGLQLVLKEDSCTADVDAEVTLSSTFPAELLIITHTPTEITADAYLPALAEPYTRFYRVDALAGTVPTPAVYGPVTVTNT